MLVAAAALPQPATHYHFEIAVLLPFDGAFDPRQWVTPF